MLKNKVVDDFNILLLVFFFTNSGVYRFEKKRKLNYIVFYK